MPAENDIFSRMVCLFGRILYAQDFDARRKVSTKSVKDSTVKHPAASTPTTTKAGGRLTVTHRHLPSITSTATQASEEETASSSSSKLGSDESSLSGGKAVLPPSRPDIASRVTSHSRNSYAGRSSRPSSSRNRMSGMNIGSRPTSSSRNSPRRRSSAKAKTPIARATVEEMTTCSNLDSTDPPSYSDVVHAIGGVSQCDLDAPPTYETLFKNKSSALSSSLGQSL